MKRILIPLLLLLILLQIMIVVPTHAYNRTPGSYYITNVEPNLRDFIKITKFYPNPHFIIGDLYIIGVGYYRYFNITMYIVDQTGIKQEVQIFRDIYDFINVYINGERCFYSGQMGGFLFVSSDYTFQSQGYFVWLSYYNETHFTLRIEYADNQFLETGCYLEAKTVYIDSRNNEGYFNIYNVDYVRVTRIELEPVTVYTLSGFTTRFLNPNHKTSCVHRGVDFKEFCL
ncbi:MAG: hypothetical protein QW607_06730 [Desulfurococcaceae archaeon]